MATIQSTTSTVTGFQYRSVQTKTALSSGKAAGGKAPDQLLQLLNSAGSNTWQESRTQTALFHFLNLSDDLMAEMTYNGAPISELSPEQATELVGPDGYFGVEKTALRIAEFVLKGAGDDVARLKSGRQGILAGFKQAEEAWGGTLPDISYETLEKALGMIDEKLDDLGASAVDISA